MGFESAFCMKTIKSTLFKTYLKRSNSQTPFYLGLGSVHFQGKNIENFNSLSV